MMSPAEARKTLHACFLCGDTRIAVFGYIVPVKADTLTALLKLRQQPLDENETPTVWFALCRQHARSSARVEAKILAAAETVAAH